MPKGANSRRPPRPEGPGPVRQRDQLFLGDPYPRSPGGPTHLEGRVVSDPSALVGINQSGHGYSLSFLCTLDQRALEDDPPIQRPPPGPESVPKSRRQLPGLEELPGEIAEAHQGPKQGPFVARVP